MVAERMGGECDDEQREGGERRDRARRRKRPCGIDERRRRA